MTFTTPAKPAETATPSGSATPGAATATPAPSVSAFANKPVNIVFPSGSATLDENSKYIIDMEFGDIAKMFATSRIRIEGNTDNIGSAESNKALSLQRAQAVADYLVAKYGFDPNRFVIVGNGPDKPVATNDTEEGRAKNRRTEFFLLEN